MTTARRILLPVHTTATWGGLQDWAVGMVRGLSELGREVGLVSNNALVRERAAAYAAEVFDVDWSDWRSLVPRIEEAGPWDVIFAQPFGGRRLGVELHRRSGTPLAYMSHGSSSDEAYTWAGLVDAVLLASSSLTDLMTDFVGVEPGLVHVLANGASPAFFPDRPATFEERISSEGAVRVVLASRLSPDKLNQIPATQLLVQTLLEEPRIGAVQLEVLGGGPSATTFERELRLLEADSRIEVEMVGWGQELTVRDRMREALFTVGGGVTGTQSMCLGTACLGAGIRSIVGLSTPRNMDLVLGSNFGDHRVYCIERQQIVEDIRWFLDPGNYSRFQEVYQPLMRSERTHAAVAARAASLLDGAVARAKTRA